MKFNKKDSKNNSKNKKELIKNKKELSKNKKELSKNKKELIVISILFLTNILFCINDIVVNDKNIIQSILLALCDVTLMIVIIDSIHKPVRSMILLLVNNFINMIYDLALGESAGEAIGTQGVAWIIGLIMLAVFCKEANKAIITENKKIIDIINYDRPIRRIGVLLRIAVDAMLITFVIGLTGSETVASMSTGPVYAIYSAFAVLYATFLVIAVATNTTILLDISLAQFVAQIYAVYKIYSLGKFEPAHLLVLVNQLVILVYIVSELIKLRKASKDSKANKVGEQKH